MKHLFKKINSKATRSIVLGLVLALTISFGSSLLVGAATSLPGVPDVQPFIGESTTLMSRIGSLAIGRASVPSWITINTLECSTKNHAEYKHTCLDVLGGATFANLLINQTGYFNADTVVGVTGGGLGGGGFSLDNSTLVIENSGANSGFMVSGLGYRGSTGNGPFAPRNLTTTATVCATANGTLRRCTEAPTLTYSWQVGNWGICTGVVQPVCNGSYQTTNGGVCQGTWQTPGPGLCSGTYYDTVPGNPIGSHTSSPVRHETADGRNCYQVDDGGSWQLNCQAPSPDEFCHLSNVQVCDYEQIQVPKNCSIYNANQTGCQNKSGCTWNVGQPITNYCSPATNQQACIARNPACTWNPSTTTVSCVGPTTQNECTSQNPACTFNPGNPGNHTRSVVCKASNGQTVADQLCIENVSPKPITTEACS